MTVHVTVPMDETEKAELERIARHEEMTLKALLNQLIRQRLDYDAWFRAEVQNGLDAVARGELVPHQEVVAQMHALFQELTEREAGP